MPDQVEFRRCQKCGQVERVGVHEIVVPGRHPGNCDNDVENWRRFKARCDWRPLRRGSGRTPSAAEGVLSIPTLPSAGIAATAPRRPKCKRT
jgi:hypothetical protein